MFTSDTNCIRWRVGLLSTGIAAGQLRHSDFKTAGGGRRRFSRCRSRQTSLLLLRAPDRNGPTREGPSACDVHSMPAGADGTLRRQNNRPSYSTAIDSASRFDVDILLNEATSRRATLPERSRSKPWRPDPRRRGREAGARRCLQGGFVYRGHTCGPRTNRARSRRSISNGVMHLIPRPMHASGILILRVDAEGTSCVTTVCWPASA